MKGRVAGDVQMTSEGKTENGRLLVQLTALDVIGAQNQLISILHDDTNTTKPKLHVDLRV